MSNHWIQTSSGKAYEVLDPTAEMICIEDIAGGLARICRFSGQLRADVEFYSVAQHSVLVSRLVPPELALYGLLHDASEALLGDVTSPVKQHLPSYRELEERAMHVIANHFGINQAGFECEEIHHADAVALATEKRDLLGPEPKPWFPMPEPDASTIEPLLPKAAEALFMARFSELRSVVQ